MLWQRAKVGNDKWMRGWIERRNRIKPTGRSTERSVWKCCLLLCDRTAALIGTRDNTVKAGCGSGMKPASCYRKVASLIPLVCMSKCPWIRYRTPNCSWCAGWHLAWQPPPSVCETVTVNMSAGDSCPHCTQLILKTSNYVLHYIWLWVMLQIMNHRFICIAPNTDEQTEHGYCSLCSKVKTNRFGEFHENNQTKILMSDNSSKLSAWKHVGAFDISSIWLYSLIIVW